MKRTVVLSAALFTLAMGVVVAANVDSGLKPGDDADAFTVKDCTGPNAGSSLCYR